MNSKEELQRLLNDIQTARVGVIGDFCVDAYWFIAQSASEISVETGLPTRPVQKQRYTLGGAGNVVMNLLDLGVGQVRVFGVVGSDPFGYQMRQLLTSPRVDLDGLLVQPSGWDTHVYTKPYAEDKEQSRIDFGNFNALADAVAADLLARLEAQLGGLDIVLVNEQVIRGIHHSEFFRERLAALIARHPDRRFILDSRHFSGCYEGAIRKINDREAARLCGIQRGPGDLVLYEEACKATETLWSQFKRPVFVSRGARGVLVCDEKGVQEVPGLLILGRTDSVGAGDSMLSGISAALAAGRDSLTAAQLGNFVAGVTVQKLFITGTATPAEVMAIGASPDYVYRPELADDPRRARFIPGTEFEIVSEQPPSTGSGRFTHVILDHDGTISTLREGWEKIMEPVMIRSILGERYAHADESLYHNVVTRVREYIDKTTGIQTIQQMEGLVAMVREFRCVPPENVLDAAGYKKIYNEALMALVNERIAKLRRGELAVEDYTLKNAVPFLRALHKAGLKLYLASGTDEEDVRNEAAGLGYAGLFEGRIYGSVDRADQDAKRIVLERILADVGERNAAHLLTFGDGPVEIRETHKRGGFAVGIASDEVRRFGGNPAKRGRLIRAGADMLIPDYSQLPRLLAVLGIPH